MSAVRNQPARPAAQRPPALGLYLLSGAGGEFTLRGDGLVLACALAFAAHILATGHGVERYDAGALVAVQLLVCGAACIAIAAAAGQPSSRAARPCGRR